MRRSGQRPHSPIAQEFCPHASIYHRGISRQFPATSQVLLPDRKIDSNSRGPLVLGYSSFLCHLCPARRDHLPFRLAFFPPPKYLISRGVAKFPAHPRNFFQSTFPSQVLPFTIFTLKIFAPRWFPSASDYSVSFTPSIPAKHIESTKKHIHFFSHATSAGSARSFAKMYPFPSQVPATTNSDLVFCAQKTLFVPFIQKLAIETSCHSWLPYVFVSFVPLCKIFFRPRSTDGRPLPLRSPQYEYCNSPSECSNRTSQHPHRAIDRSSRLH